MVLYFERKQLSEDSSVYFVIKLMSVRTDDVRPGRKSDGEGENLNFYRRVYFVHVAYYWLAAVSLTAQIISKYVLKLC